MKTIEEIVRPVYGQLCWGVEWEIQLNMSMSFGEPHLRIIREPYVSKSKSSRVREHAADRVVKVRGAWWLWIFNANWSLRVSDTRIATSSSSLRKKTAAMMRLQGQRLTDIQVNPKNGATTFTFDLGAKLFAKRWEKDDWDIWTLYCPNGYVLGVRGDGIYTYDRGNVPKDNLRSKPILTSDRPSQRKSQQQRARYRSTKS